MKQILIILALISFCASPGSAKKPQSIPMSHFIAKNIDGIWYGWYKDKKIKPLKGSYVIISDDYQRHGKFVKGIFEGIHTVYDLRENLLETREYQSGRLIRRTTYYHNGNLKTDTGYDNAGQLHGIYTEYYDDGSVMCSLMYVNGNTEGDYVVRYRDGSLKSVTPMKYGTSNGVVCEWDEQGRLIAETHMCMGEIHGERVSYIYNIQNPIKTVATYDKGMIYGDRLGYFILGGDMTTLAYRYRYDGDEIVSAELFDINGILESKYEYVDGKLSVWTYYSQGVPTNRIDYDGDGEIIYQTE